MKTILLVFGTRPEAIKMAPLVKAFQHNPEDFKTIVCVTGQHREMLDQVLKIFEIKPDYDLNIMKQGQDLYDVTARVLTGMRDVLKEVRPDVVLVHGDTTTSTAAALAAFYQQIPVGHVEAGLRTHNVYSPGPEEMNRQITGRIATYHFAPTQLSRKNLLAEGVGKHNAGLFHQIDKRQIFKRLNEKHVAKTCQIGAEHLVYGLSHIGVEVHGVYEIDVGIFGSEVAYGVADVEKAVAEVFASLTDSGGIQEEAPSLGKPVLVMRTVTERPEALEAGTIHLVGTDRAKIVDTASLYLNDEDEYRRHASIANPYGDGKACSRIIAYIDSHLR